jgi:hypothetical protein
MLLNNTTSKAAERIALHSTLNPSHYPLFARASTAIKAFTQKAILAQCTGEKVAKASSLWPIVFAPLLSRSPAGAPPEHALRLILD